PVAWFGCEADINPKPNNLDRRFRIYSETLSRFSCAASPGEKALLKKDDYQEKVAASINMGILRYFTNEKELKETD
ncbi:hypothetical protein ACO1D1_15035, partial [Neobacillus sp. 19]